MKRYLIILIFSLTLINCTRINEKEEIIAEVQQVLDQYYSSIETKNVELFSELTSQDSSVTAFFMDSQQRINGWTNIQKQIKGLFERSDQIKIWRKNELLQVAELSNVVWITSDNLIELVDVEQTKSKNYHFTAILEKIGGMWQFVHFHESIISDGVKDSLSSISLSATNETKVSIKQDDEKSKKPDESELLHKKAPVKIERTDSVGTEKSTIKSEVSDTIKTKASLDTSKIDTL